MEGGCCSPLSAALTFLEAQEAVRRKGRKERVIPINCVFMDSESKPLPHNFSIMTILDCSGQIFKTAK